MQVLKEEVTDLFSTRLNNGLIHSGIISLRPYSSDKCERDEELTLVF